LEISKQCGIFVFVLFYGLHEKQDVKNVIPETRRVHEIRYLRVYYYHWVDTSAGGLLVPNDVILLVASA